MNVGRRLYWKLLHTSIARLYLLTAFIAICILGSWLYFWYMPYYRIVHQSQAIDNVTTELV